MTTKQRYQQVIEWFKTAMPVAETELHYDTPFHLLLAVILSAQCTDKRVNLITPALFRRYPSPESLAVASFDEVYELIKSCSYPNNKARHLIGASKMLVEEFNSEIPADIDSLVKLPGVGRKTANVMLAVVFNKAAMAVDTHVFRVSERIGLTNNSKSPLETEKTLCKHIPDEIIPLAHHWLILHGRYVCKSRRPDCLNCGLTSVCKYFQQGNK
ncbi:MAG: endonuclease III [Muribaculaceae bacterium]|nr:endonuclease III [Muribaculaceae bacterium]